MKIVLLIIGGLSLLWTFILYCCCVSAGRADRAREIAFQEYLREKNDN